MNIRDPSDDLTASVNNASVASDKERCLAAIRDLAELQYGWNGYGAAPIEPASLEAAERIVVAIAADRRRSFP